MATIIEKETGTANAGPEPEQKWITLQEAEKYEKWIGRHFVKRDDPKDAKKFFYQIISIHPYQPMAKKFEDIGSTDDCRYQFNVQKYHRHQTIKATVRPDERTSTVQDVPKPVEGHEWRARLKGEGAWVLVDPRANFFIDVETFKNQFELDKIEE